MGLDGLAGWGPASPPLAALGWPTLSCPPPRQAPLTHAWFADRKTHQAHIVWEPHPLDTLSLAVAPLHFFFLFFRSAPWLQPLVLVQSASLLGLIRGPTVESMHSVCSNHAIPGRRPRCFSARPRTKQAGLSRPLFFFFLFLSCVVPISFPLSATPRRARGINYIMPVSASSTRLFLISASLSQGFPSSDRRSLIQFLSDRENIPTQRGYK